MSATVHAGVSLDLARRMPENPAFVSLLMGKLERAERQGIHLILSLKGDIGDFYVDTIDLCRVMSCLLDNAIESAAKSDNRRIHLTCDNKDADSKLMILTNSISAPVEISAIRRYGAPDKQAHSGIGLRSVRSTLDKYPNAVFQIKSHDHELSVYIEFNRH